MISLRLDGPQLQAQTVWLVTSVPCALQFCMLQLVCKVEASVHKGLDMHIRNNNLRHCVQQ